MGDWKRYLNNDPTGWLLGEDNPSVRYLTLTEILSLSPGDPEAVKAMGNIMSTGPVPRILDKQNEGGYWGVPGDFYVRSKYKGTVWTLLLLAQLGADGNDPRVKKACEFILANSQDVQSGGFAYRLSRDGRGGSHEAVLPCLTGNMAFCLIRFGCGDDTRLRRAIDWITAYQRFDDGGAAAPKGWPYENFPKCFGRHTCHMGVVKCLKALAEIPPDKRSPEVNATIARGAEYILMHRIYRSSHNPAQIAMPEWLRFGYPLMWNDDALEVLEILLKLGYRDGRMREAVDRVISKQDANGRWELENTWNWRTLVSLERKGQPSKWVTLKAMKVIKSWNDAL